MYTNVLRAQQQAETMVEHAQILGVGKIDTAQLSALAQSLEPHHAFWTTTAQMKVRGAVFPIAVSMCTTYKRPNLVECSYARHTSNGHGMQVSRSVVVIRKP